MHKNHENSGKEESRQLYCGLRNVDFIKIVSLKSFSGLDFENKVMLAKSRTSPPPPPLILINILCDHFLVFLTMLLLLVVHQNSLLKATSLEKTHVYTIAMPVISIHAWIFPITSINICRVSAAAKILLEVNGYLQNILAWWNQLERPVRRRFKKFV